MSTINLNWTFGNIRTITTIFLDIFIMWFVLYYAIRIIRSNERTIQIFKGILLVVIIDALAKFLGLKTLEYIADMFINWGFLAFIIIFQPEIRGLLERIGKSNAFSRITTLTGNEKENLVDQIVTATMLLSKDQTGALISIEQSHSLNDYVATGTRMNSDVTAELLTSIFVTSTPLHDGAVIIQGDKIACASAYFPPTNLELPSRYGARHRAAIGISEITDAVTIIVSEETGSISITEGGKIFHVNERQLRNYLLRVICGEETEVHSSSYAPDVEPAREVLIAEEKKEPESTNTGVLSKIAIKKQDTGEIETDKIEAEEIVVDGVVQEKEEDSLRVEDEKKNSFHLFGLGKKKEEDAMHHIEEEMADIKLPKKKKRKKPSYPSAKVVKTPKEETKPEEVVEEKVEEVVAQPVVEEEPPVEEVITEEVVEEEPTTEVLDELEVSAAPRMTAEEVRRAREEYMQKFSNKKETTELEETLEDLKDKTTEEKEEVIYDTSKLDLSKIVGLSDELDKTLNMVDQLDETSEKKEGGEDK